MPSPAPEVRRRPWYLIVALIICSFLGSVGTLEGWETIDVYRTDHIDTSEITRDISRESNRAAAQASINKLMGALQAERPRLFPMGAAELVLGLAALGLSIGAMSGRRGARSALVQVMIVQAALVIAMDVATPRVRAATLDLDLTIRSATLRENGKDPQLVDEATSITRKIAPAMEVGKLVVRTLVVGLIVIALTRRRTREFYEAASEQTTHG